MKKLFKIDSDDHGRGLVRFKWQPEGNLLATAGRNRLVHIFGRHGDRIDEINLQSEGPVLALEWDCTGDCLAILQEGSGTIPIWDQSSRSVLNVDTNLKDATFICWSKVGPQLAVGTSKGNLLIYDKKTTRKTPVLGKHPKRITCGAWSRANQLALGSEDRSMTLSNESGDTLEQTELKYAPLDIQFAVQKQTGHRAGREEQLELKENVVSINMRGKSLLLYSLSDPENPMELAFQPKYGDIVTHKWFGDGFMLLGFSEGFIVVVSTHISEIGEEQFCGKLHEGQLVDVAYSPVLKRAATAGTGGIKIVDMTNHQELTADAIPLTSDEGNISGLAWSPDGQILTVASRQGVVYNFLARMPTVHDSCGPRIALLSSLREVSVVDTTDHIKPVTVRVAIEPSFVALGPHHIAVGMNNRVMYYRAQPEECDLAQECEYNGQVGDLRLNDKFAAVLAGQQVVLHTIDPNNNNGQQQRRTFPEREDGGFQQATAVALTDNFLIYATKAGTVEFFFVPEWASLPGAELRHSCAVKRLYPNYLGTRLVIVDSANAGYVYSPTSGDLPQLPSFPPSCRHVMWDQTDRNVILASDGAELHTYVFTPITIRGALVSKLGPVEVDGDGAITISAESSRIPAGFVPVLSDSGRVTCQLDSGALQSFTALPYENADVLTRVDVARQRRQFLDNLGLLRLKQAWRAALQLDHRPYWLALSNKAMEVMDVQMAVHVYRQLGDAGMVMGLERVAHVEDRSLLAGHMALLFGDYQTAQDLFLQSSRPVSALEMQRDLLHWDQALKLASTLALHQVPELSAEYGQQLEFRGENDQALRMYENALGCVDSEGRPIDCGAEQRKTCQAGVARCTLRLGDLRRGIRLARNANDRQLYRECAGILEDMKQTAEAAALYELGEQFEKAAAIYIQTKSFGQAAAVMPRVTLPKLLSQYAKVCEASGNWAGAAEAHERARDMDSVVRLCLDQLNQPHRACEIVRATASSTGAQMVSRYCQAIGDWRGTIEFLVMAKRSDEAFNLAKSHSQMNVFTEVLGDNISPDEARSAARYYEAQHEMGKAGRFYSLCGQYHRALKLFLQCGEKEVDAAIAVVGKARNDMLTHTLIDFLMGETDGVPKDPNYTYRLYMALGNYAQAAKTAVIIAKHEQDLGNYKGAHSIMYETIRQLEEQGVRVPQALRKGFVLLHSYILVKKLLKRDDHVGAARMLLRVARNISKFPSHVVPILISTVIECQRSGLKNSAFDYASMLMRQEYRKQIDTKFRRNIEAIVRRPNKEEEPENTTPCPISGAMIPATELECPTTKDAIPMCVVTGRHMEKENWCICPVSRMPALLSAYNAYLEYESKSMAQEGEARPPVGVHIGPDPVLGKPVSSGDLRKATHQEVVDYIKLYNAADEPEKESKPEQGAAAKDANKENAGREQQQTAM